MRRRYLLLAATAAAGPAGLGWTRRDRLRATFAPVLLRLRGRRNLDDALADHGPAARRRLRQAFRRVGLPYPPTRITLIGLKAERRLEIWAEAGESRPRHVVTFPIRAASGGPGPKLEEGDRQVPEGLYPITYLNPNSRYRLSLRIGYPSDEDRALAAADGRTDLGGDIMIHGKGGSIGCLALDDSAAEDLFILAADVGIDQVSVILAPHDMRGRAVPSPPAGSPSWTSRRYRAIHREIARFQNPR